MILLSDLIFIWLKLQQYLDTWLSTWLSLETHHYRLNVWFLNTKRAELFTAIDCACLSLNLAYQIGLRYTQCPRSSNLIWNNWLSKEAADGHFLNSTLTRKRMIDFTTPLDGSRPATIGGQAIGQFRSRHPTYIVRSSRMLGLTALWTLQSSNDLTRVSTVTQIGRLEMGVLWLIKARNIIQTDSISADD